MKINHLITFVVFAASLLGYSFRLSTPSFPVWDEVLQIPAARSLLTFDKTKYTHTENPPLGKAVLAASLHGVGDTPFGHRLPSAMAAAGVAALLFGLSLMISGSRIAAGLAAGLWLTSTMGYLHARIGTLDMLTAFFFLAGFGAFLKAVAGESISSRRRTYWLFLACLLAALGGTIKVLCFLLFPLFLLGLALVGKRWRRKESLAAFAVAAPACLALAVFGIYWAFGYPPGEAAAQLKFIYDFHSHDVTTHPFLSRWYDWLLLRGNLWYVMSKQADGQVIAMLCTANPVLWALGQISLLGLAVFARIRKSPEYLLVVAAVLLQLLFWAVLKKRTLLYYALPMEPFFCMSVGLFFFELFKKKERSLVLFWAALIVSVSAYAFSLSYPFLNGEPLDRSEVLKIDGKTHDHRSGV